MKRSFLFLPEKYAGITAFLIIFLIAITGRPPVATAQQNKFFIANGKKVNIPEFDNKINKMIEEVGVPGVSVAIISNNKVVYSNGYGYRQAGKTDKVDDETLFEACSVSKTYTAFAALKLGAEGKLDLDKPMYLYVENERMAHDPRYKLITSRMALCHTTGLENWIWNNNRDTLEILYQPGERYTYSGEGYQYLARVIETILHKPHEQYIREMILDPLNLHRTFTHFSENGSYPVNYAVGHNIVQKPFEKWKNAKPLPAAGVHVSAHDYAQFLIQMFNRKRLPDSERKNMLSPYILLDEEKPNIFRGTGFEVLYLPGDTIISHSGNNTGFKAFLAYSVVSKSGFVLFANGDLGVEMSKYVCDLTVGLNVNPFFSTDIIPQYPSPAFSFLRIYREKGPEAMFAEIQRRCKQEHSKDLVHTLNGLAELLYSMDKESVKRLLEDNINLYPNDPEAFYLLGEVCMGRKQYQDAYKYFVKSKDMGFNTVSCDRYLDECRKMLQ